MLRVKRMRLRVMMMLRVKISSHPHNQRMTSHNQINKTPKARGGYYKNKDIKNLWNNMEKKMMDNNFDRRYRYIMIYNNNGRLNIIILIQEYKWTQTKREKRGQYRKYRTNRIQTINYLIQRKSYWINIKQNKSQGNWSRLTKRVLQI